MALACGKGNDADDGRDSALLDLEQLDDGACWSEERGVGGPEVANGDLRGASDVPVMGCCSLPSDAPTHGV